MNTEIPIESYPLCWPDGQPRVPPSARKGGAFKITAGVAQWELQNEVRMLGGRNLIVSSNVRVKANGMPYAGEREPNDPGVAIYFEWDKTPRAMACDAYDRVWKNIRALALCIDALRSLDRHGSSAILERAFRGFAALPSGDPTAAWWDVLGIALNASVEQIEDAYRAAALRHHPDKAGGNADTMARLTAAREAALAARGVA